MKDKLLPILIISSAFIFIIRLFWLQIIDVDEAQLFKKNSVERVYQYPERGYIYDRNNTLVVGNESFYDLMIIPKNVTKFDTIEFCKILRIKKNELIDKIKKAKKFSSIKPSVLLSQISKEDFAIILYLILL